MADDASTDPNVKKILTEYQQLDERIRVVFREQNGHISEATNSAFSDCYRRICRLTRQR